MIPKLSMLPTKLQCLLKIFLDKERRNEAVNPCIHNELHLPFYPTWFIPKHSDSTVYISNNKSEPSFYNEWKYQSFLNFVNNTTNSRKKTKYLKLSVQIVKIHCTIIPCFTPTFLICTSSLFILWANRNKQWCYCLFAIMPGRQIILKRSPHS